jgi:hypothetical protein
LPALLSWQLANAKARCQKNTALGCFRGGAVNVK